MGTVEAAGPMANLFHDTFRKDRKLECSVPVGLFGASDLLTVPPRCSSVLDKKASPSTRGRRKPFRLTKCCFIVNNFEVVTSLSGGIQILIQSPDRPGS